MNELSFIAKIYDIYFSMNSFDKSRFRAFCILLQAIKFTPSSQFINTVLPDVSKHRMVYKKLLFGHLINSKIKSEFQLRYSDIDFIFKALLYLKTTISTRLMYTICEHIDDVKIEKYMKSLFYSYFNLLKTDTLSTFNQLDLTNQITALKKNIQNSNQRKQEKFGPRMSISSSIWENKLPYYIKTIPMGGQNKKY